MHSKEKTPPRWRTYTPVLFALLAFFAADVFFDNRWLSISAACAMGIMSSELIGMFFERKRPFSEIKSPKIIPIILLLVVSMAMLIWERS